MKFDREAGAFQLGSDFQTHLENCAKCQRFDIEAPHTLVHLCLEGSILWKQANVIKPKPAPKRDEPNYRVSKKKAKAAMRYRG